jgi:hypothetical protein
MADGSLEASARQVNLLLVVTVIVFSAHLMADQLQLRIGIYENPPKVFTSESGDPSGIFVDIIEAIAELEGWELSYVHGTWMEGLNRLEAGEIDLMPDVAFSEARGSLYRFHSELVLSDWFQVYASRESGIRSIPDLDGKRVAVLEGSVQEEAFLQIVEGFDLGVTLVPLTDYSGMLDSVSNGFVDAAIINRYFGSQNACGSRLVETAVIFHPTRLYFAGSQNLSYDVLDALDRRLLEMKRDPGSVYYSSIERLTSQRLPVAVPDWVRILLIAVAIALAVSVVSGFMLKHLVNSRTRELRNLNRSMEERISQRTAELEIATEKAMESDTLKSAFLATMSHELRTPLNSIIGFTGILLQELAGPLNDEQRKQLGMVQSSARHLLALINDVLDISKIEAGQLELSPSTFDPNGSVRDMANLVAPLAQKKGLDLQVELSPEPYPILTDKRRMEQIILNLLTNAVKFTERGTVKVSCAPIGNGVRISVSDTGVGIEEKDMPVLYKPFQQIDSGLSRKHEGTGLGLSICKRIIDIMGGSIDVQSTPGVGSVFTVMIPGI